MCDALTAHFQAQIPRQFGAGLERNQHVEGAVAERAMSFIGEPH
jgi:hypothetical protein